MTKAPRDKDERQATAHKEWDRLETQDESEQLKGGRLWLERYGDLPVAGKVIDRLLSVKPSKLLIDRAEAWLQDHRHDEYALLVLAHLVQIEH